LVYLLYILEFFKKLQEGVSMQTAEMSKLSEIIDSRSQKERVIGGYG
jgi:hypothetical protein